MLLSCLLLAASQLQPIAAVIFERWIHGVTFDRAQAIVVCHGNQVTHHDLAGKLNWTIELPKNEEARTVARRDDEWVIASHEWLKFEDARPSEHVRRFSADTRDPVSAESFHASRLSHKNPDLQPVVGSMSSDGAWLLLFPVDVKERPRVLLAETANSRSRMAIEFDPLIRGYVQFGVAGSQTLGFISDHRAEFYDLRQKRFVTRIDGPFAYSQPSAWSDTLAALVMQNGDLGLYSLPDGRLIERLTGPVHGATLSANGRFLAFLDEDNYVQVCRIDDGAQWQTTRLHYGSLGMLLISEDGRYLITTWRLGGPPTGSFILPGSYFPRGGFELFELPREKESE